MSKSKEAPIAVEVRSGALIPADAWAAEEIEKLPRGTRFHCYLTIAKSAVDDEHGRLLSRYMTGMQEVFDYLPNTGPGTEYPTANHLRRMILCELGFCITHPQRDGSVKKEAQSMARDKMDFAELQVCFEMTRTYVGAYTEAVTGKRYEPWQEWEDAHPPQGAVQ